MNIWAIGRNYRAHASELGNPVPESPLIFLKSGDCFELEKSFIELPHWSIEIHHEVELLLRLNEQKKVSHAAIALDLTERHYQGQAKQKGQPWTLAKSFKGSCPSSAFFPVSSWQELENLELKLWVNDELRQHGHTRDMIFPIPHIIAFIDQHFPLQHQDLILTGTPEGVGPLQAGDIVRAAIPGKVEAQWQVRKAPNK